MLYTSKRPRALWLSVRGSAGLSVEVGMFSVGDRVIHPGQGLCTVVGFAGEPTSSLVLACGTGRRETHLLYPMAKAEQTLRAPVSREEALAVVAGYAELAPDPRTDRNSGLEEAYFKGLIKHGVPDSVRVVKTMRTRIAAASTKRHKPSAYMIRVLKEAQRRSLEELACSLDVASEEVVAMFGEFGQDFSPDPAKRGRR